MKIYKNIQIEDLDGEVWIDALGYDGVYEVSNLGRIKSLRRFVNNGKSGRWVKEKIRKQTLGKDGRLTCPLSVNGNVKSINVQSFIFYSFFPNLINDNLNDEVYHKNKIQSDNRLVNLGYNKIKGTSYSISIKLGNVKHLKQMVEVHHKYSLKTAVFKDGRIIKRLCKKCNTLKPQSKYERYGVNVCKECKKIEKSKRYYSNKSKQISKLS